MSKSASMLSSPTDKICDLRRQVILHTFKSDTVTFKSLPNVLYIGVIFSSLTFDPTSSKAISFNVSSFSLSSDDLNSCNDSNKHLAFIFGIPILCTLFIIAMSSFIFFMINTACSSLFHASKTLVAVFFNCIIA